MDGTQAVEFRYSALESVRSGVAADQALAAEVELQGAERVFLIGSASLSSATDQFNALREALGKRFAGLFTSVRAHTPRPDVMAALAAAREVNADMLVSVGGGSIIDACKAVQLAIDQDIHSEAQLLEYSQAADGSRGSRAGNYELFSATAAIRQIAIPTTLSGAEFSNNAGVLDLEKSAKEGYKGPNLCPQSIIYDPVLSKYTPEWLWLSTAIRSLDHAVEGYCSDDCHVYLDGHFLHAMKLFAESLPLTRQDPENQLARSMNQQAVWLACCGLGTVSHGASHGIGYILGSLCGVPHGHTSCVMLPAVLEWNAKNYSAEEKARQQNIAIAMGSVNSSASNAVRQLVSGLGLPGNLQEVGVQKEQLQEIAARAFQHPVVRNNPANIEYPEQVLEILELAWNP